MNENTAQSLVVPAVTSQDVLTEILLDGAQRLLGQAIEAEVEGWLESHKHRVDENSHRQVVGNGRLPKKKAVHTHRKDTGVCGDVRSVAEK